MQSNLEQHSDVVTSTFDDIALLRGLGVQTKIQRQVFLNFANPVKVISVLTVMRPEGGVVRTLSGRHYLIRGHSDRLDSLFQGSQCRSTVPGHSYGGDPKEKFVVNMVLLRCAYGGLTYSGFTTTSNSPLARGKLAEFFQVEPSAAVPVLADATDAEWETARVDEETAAKANTDAELKTPGGFSGCGTEMPVSLAGQTFYTTFGYNALSDAKFESSLCVALKIGDVCPCGSGKAYAKCRFHVAQSSFYSRPCFIPSGCSNRLLTSFYPIVLLQVTVTKGRCPFVF